MKNHSLLAHIARIAIVTAIAVVALILLATYASVMNTQRGAGMMASVTSSAPAPMFPSSTDGYAARDMMLEADSSTTTGVAISDENAAAPIDQKVIKTASLDIEARSAADTAERIATIAVTAEGFVQSSMVREDEDGKHYADVVIRVPAERFDAAIAEIEDLADRVNIKSVDGQDVTEQFTDVAARLTAAEAQETQYLAILAQAETVGEVLAVQEHLASVRAEIESLQGQINFLENRASLSTIIVAVAESPSTTLPNNDKFDLGRDARGALALVIALGQQLLSFLVWVLIIGAAIGIPVGIAAVIVRAITHRNTAPKRRK